MAHSADRYRDLNSFLRSRFGCRVQKITVDAGMTCPNRDGRLSRSGCIYCNPKGSGTGAWAKGRSIKEQILAGQKALKRRYKARKFLVYFQSFTNTYAPIDTLAELYGQALGMPGVVGLSIGTRPDCVDENVLSLLEQMAHDHMIWIEYGLQSAHDPTLDLINRGHDYACFEKALALTQNRGILTCAHVIIGLPGEGGTVVRRTAKKMARAGIDGIKLHLLYVIRGTELEKWYRQGRYQCLERAQYVEQVCDFIAQLPPRVVIQRLTSDPHARELVAPMWALRKMEVLTAIGRRLQDKDTWQGKALGHSMSEVTDPVPHP
jgi:radical SAM protein (TIGR01212 family)